MICVDTTFLVDLWRDPEPTSAPGFLLASRAGEEFAVPAHAAGEFLEGGAAVSPERLGGSLDFLRIFRVGEVTIETAIRYARIVAALRGRSLLHGRSKPDLWIAAWAVEHAAALATRNVKHFSQIEGLTLIDY